MESYKGLKYILRELQPGAMNKQIQSLESFDDIFNSVFTGAMADVVQVAAAHSQEDLQNKYKGYQSGDLEGQIFNRVWKGQQKTKITGSYGVRKSAAQKGLAQERGRFYGKTWWKGKYFLHFGVADKRQEIRELYAKAQEEIINRVKK